MRFLHDRAALFDDDGHRLVQVRITNGRPDWSRHHARLLDSPRSRELAKLQLRLLLAQVEVARTVVAGVQLIH
jgi:hypothetical protein